MEKSLIPCSVSNSLRVWSNKNLNDCHESISLARPICYFLRYTFALLLRELQR